MNYVTPEELIAARRSLPDARTAWDVGGRFEWTVAIEPSAPVLSLDSNPSPIGPKLRIAEFVIERYRLGDTMFLRWKCSTTVLMEALPDGY